MQKKQVSLKAADIMYSFYSKIDVRLVRVKLTIEVKTCLGNKSDERLVKHTSL